MEKNHALSILQPHLEKIYEILVRNWNLYFTQYAEVLYIHSSRTRANLIRDHIVADVREEFADIKDARIVEQKDGLFLLVIEDKISVRFKKLDQGKRSSNIRTKQASLFANPLGQLDLPGVPAKATKLNIGYMVNEHSTELEGIYVAQPNGVYGVSWFCDVEEHITTTTKQVDSSVLPLVTGNTATPRVSLKKDAIIKKKRSNDGQNN